MPEHGSTSQCSAPPGKTLSASFGPKWPYKRTMSAPASIVPRQESKIGIPLTFPFPKIFFSNQVLVPSTEKEKVYSRQISAPILKRKTSRFGLGQFLSGSSNSNASTSTAQTPLVPVPSVSAAPHLPSATTATAPPAHTTNITNAGHPHSYNPFSIHSHSHQVHPASGGLQSQTLLQGNACEAMTPKTAAGQLTATASVRGQHPHPHNCLSTHPHKQPFHHHHYQHHHHHERHGEGPIGGTTGGQGRPRA